MYDYYGIIMAFVNRWDRHWERSLTRYNKIPIPTAALGCSAHIDCPAFRLLSDVKVELKLPDDALPRRVLQRQERLVSVPSRC